MRILNSAAGVVSVLAAVLLGGCAKPPPAIVEVEGTVLLNGEPLSHAKVLFVPQFENSSEYIAQGVTDEAGHFALRCRGQAGACVGENIVAVSEEDIPPNLTPESARAELQKYLKGLKNRPIPPSYRAPSSSPLRETVTAGPREYKIELTR